MTLAIFDLDNTLIAGDSDHSWGEFLVHKQLVDADEYRRQNDRFYHEYQAGSLDIDAYLNFALRPLTQHHPERLAELQQEFMLEWIEPLLLTRAQILLDQHRQKGDFLLIITATNSFITRPIAERLGVDDLLATEPECVDGRYTGRVAGTPCFREGKVTRLQQWLIEHPYSLKSSYFYSDSNNDLPLLEQVSHPVVVDPDPHLHAVAKERNWPVISLRD
ncbi:HAD family phosphatase [Marinimicrobium sp. ABcell2]|uniref:histidinol-phosphatase n=1 Tax=Marinimicrobium sp. ABcell2 TaxID=3069751 RepID=UPI0027B0D560|nr:HAD family hydrolase [Marinimicrobium sp. ABcell2]MDQ2076545.1 HAD family hydrolase [Marinimicrobium sp. ABcell2]